MWVPKDHFVRACLEHLPAVILHTLTLQNKRPKETRHSESRSPPATETGSMNRAVDKIREQRRGRESVETKTYVPAFSQCAASEESREGVRLKRKSGPCILPLSGAEVTPPRDKSLRFQRRNHHQRLGKVHRGIALMLPLLAAEPRSRVRTAVQAQVSQERPRREPPKPPAVTF